MPTIPANLDTPAMMYSSSFGFLCVGIAALALFGCVAWLVLRLMKDGSRESASTPRIPPPGTPSARPPTVPPQRTTEQLLDERERRVREAERLADLEAREAALRARSQGRAIHGSCRRCGNELPAQGSYCARCGERREG